MEAPWGLNGVMIGNNGKEHGNYMKLLCYCGLEVRRVLIIAFVFVEVMLVEVCPPLVIRSLRRRGKGRWSIGNKPQQNGIYIPGPSLYP